jgi:hypothetical protein
MSGKRGSYEHLVSARSAEEAIEIASEACPKGAKITESKAIDAAAECGPHSWLVRIKFERQDAPDDI